MGRHEGRVGQRGLPCPPELDQVIAVGAIAMQEDDELARRPARARGEPRAIEFCRHLSSRRENLHGAKSRSSSATFAAR